MTQHKQSRRFLLASSVLVALLFLVGFLGVSSVAWLQSNTLYLPQNTVASERIGVTAIDFLDVSQRAHEAGNDSLIDQLTQPGSGILWNVVRVLKYTLGAVFMLLFAIYVITLITSRGEESAVTEFKGAVRYALVGFLIMMLAEPIAQTFNVARTGGNFITSREALVEALGSGGMSLMAAVQMVQYLLGGIALLFMGMAAFRIIFGMGDEDEVTEARKTIKWSAVGLVIAASVTFIINAVAPIPDRSAEFAAFFGMVDGLSAADQHAYMLEMSRMASRATVLSYVKYFQIIVGAAAVFMLFLAGAKMVIAAGNDDQIEKQKKIIPWIFMGLGIILFAEVFVDIFFPLQSNATIGVPGMHELKNFAAQMGGLSNFILTFMGIASVLALIVGALYMSTAIANPEQEEKGKKILLAAGLGIILTISAFALVNTVLSGRIAPGTDLSIEVQ